MPLFALLISSALGPRATTAALGLVLKRQLAIGNWQLAIGNWQLAIGGGPSSLSSLRAP